MSEIEFQPGDLVKVRSGGPVMTVKEVGRSAMLNEPTVWCTWFVGPKQMEGTFSPAVLQKVEPASVEERYFR